MSIDNYSIESLQKNLNQTQAEKDALVSYLSHDFRAPLATILALAELQRDPNICMEMEDFLTHVESACHATINSADLTVRLNRIKEAALRFELLNLQDILEERIDYYHTHQNYSGAKKFTTKLHIKSFHPTTAYAESAMVSEQELDLVYADRYWLTILLDHLLLAYIEAIEESAQSENLATMRHNLYLTPQVMGNSNHVSLRLQLPGNLKYADPWYSSANLCKNTRSLMHSQPYNEKRVLLCNLIAQRLGGSVQVGAFLPEGSKDTQSIPFGYQGYMCESLVLSLPLASS